MKMDKLKKIFVFLGSLDRRVIFLIVGLSVLVPLLKPEWMILPIEPDANTQKVFNEIDRLQTGSKVLLSFEYGPSTMPEIHPMAIALLRHMFTNKLKVYGFALWPDGNFMSTDAFSQVANELNMIYDTDYVNLGYKPGGEAVIKGIASDIWSMYTVDLMGIHIKDLKMMEKISNILDFDFVISLSAGDPGSKQWVQYATDPKKIPFTTGCTSIQVTDIIAYVENEQILGILAGMPGAAEYEKLVKDKLEGMGVEASQWEATSMLPAQTLAHIVIVIFIILGNISYFISRKKTKGNL